jgi:hypothetical protein
MRCWITQLCAWGVLLCFAIPADAAQFAIAAPTFSGFARCKDPIYTIADPAVDGRIPKAKLRDGRLYFSFRVIGQDSAINYLKQYGALEVTAVFWGGVGKIGERSIGISDDNWDRNGAALTDEYYQTGIFNWRTCAYTEKIENSSIQVQIRDANGDFASPIDVGGSYQASVTIDP